MPGPFALDTLPAAHCLINFALRAISGICVTLLDFADQLISLSRRLIQLVIRQSPPFSFAFPLSCFQLPSIWSQFVEPSFLD